MYIFYNVCPVSKKVEPRFYKGIHYHDFGPGVTKLANILTKTSYMRLHNGRQLWDSRMFFWSDNLNSSDNLNNTPVRSLSSFLKWHGGS